MLVRFLGLDTLLVIWVVCLALALGLVTIALPETPMFGISKDFGQNYRSMNLLVAVWFLVFSIPTFLWLEKDTKKIKLILI